MLIGLKNLERSFSQVYVQTMFKYQCIYFPVNALKAYGGSRFITPLMFDLSTRWRLVVNFTTLSLYPREGIPVPIK
jgi:hypothetical protein